MAEPATRLLGLAAQIVSAYCAHNEVDSEALPALIHQVRAALSDVTSGLDGTDVAAGQEGLVPAVPIKRSVFSDYIVCLEDGRKLKTLKRHLMSVYGLTPEQYREKWGLPSIYPMVAPSYTAKRSNLAKSHGLGRRAKTED